VKRGAVRLSYGGGETVAAAGAAVLIRPGTPYRLTAGAGAETAQAGFGRGLLDPAALGREAAGLLHILGAAGPARRETSPFIVSRLTREAFTQADALFRRLEIESAEKRPGFETMMKLSLMEALMVLYRSAASAGPRGDPAGALVRFSIEDAIQFVESRYSEDLSLPQIAAHFGLNPSYFSRLFARRTGMPLFAYMNRLRIQKSCILLKRSGMSILEIAFSVGYNNLSHFNRYFRRIMGESPREYRKRIET
jgi:AraC-like DNA-binding protein